jgi:tRNA U38,U39,U40 pseudouridine synthase TruA
MLAREVDPYIQEKGSLNGLMIHAKSFPGWHDFAALVSHFRFVKDHHQRIAKIAAVTDNGFLAILPSIAKHFVHADIRHFDYNNKENALKWLGTG